MNLCNDECVTGLLLKKEEEIHLGFCSDTEPVRARSSFVFYTFMPVFCYLDLISILQDPKVRHGFSV